ncbi:MAG TPA: hypothetical protein VHL34_16330 [Rhizomicrobium sp.]|nr:hypothetical protein [Rhizomicrobium sp.]
MRAFVLASVAIGFGLLGLSASQDATASVAPESKSFVVFFESNQVTLTPEGREIVKAAAERARRSHAQMITIAAPTTRVVAGYDPAVAAPRLALVRQELMANGVRRVTVAQAAASNDVRVPLVGAERVEIRVMPATLSNS